MVTRSSFSASESSSERASWDEEKAVLVNPWRDTTENEASLPTIKPSQLKLNLEDLRCFEAIDNQFRPWGISFSNAIALQPSNQAYPPHTGTIVLMGAPKSGWIEASFSTPIRYFKCYVTCSQRTVLSAYDREDRVVARAEIPGQNLAGSDSQIAPNAPLEVTANKITRVTIYAFDGQLTIDDLSFAF
ncbi:MAG: hypothetical protein SAL07_09860 [Oscillatoria sp. PMC 1051.18]|uniref:hypothetical protein n=1 Tax=Oscillatoria salina TaxID=331517 RepID=UPI0013B69E35|nr:hypothetical protein [Oscillatoria salina]MBZ8181410.1 hypothetical protein [Oscillatoria salina IIICB1]MEC4893422.1 hypothetical protein [Oscillatoria sp. PMC 1050.18]MEC5030208.1 hypothetical protein [Oscillatoria sp. PMC 1051.18]NET88716.1 hypothetical protein [Kamptonema sp. SIO1D9]